MHEIQMVVPTIDKVVLPKEKGLNEQGLTIAAGGEEEQKDYMDRYRRTGCVAVASHM